MNLQCIYTNKNMLKLSGKNTEWGYLKLIQKQGHLSHSDILQLKWHYEKSKALSVGATLTKWLNREKTAYFQNQFLYQNAMFLIKFHGWKVSLSFKNLKFCLNNVSRYSVRKKYQKIQKIAEITLTATNISYSFQFEIFGNISGSRQSQINLLTYYCLFQTAETKIIVLQK